jgi:hypothetical protein
MNGISNEGQIPKCYCLNGNAELRFTEDNCSRFLVSWTSLNLQLPEIDSFAVLINCTQCDN